MLPQSSSLMMGWYTACCNPPPKQGKGVGPENHIHASPRGSLRVVPRVKGSQDHSAHQERFIAAVQLVDGVLLRLDPIGKAASLPLRCTRRARDIHTNVKPVEPPGPLPSLPVR